MNGDTIEIYKLMVWISLVNNTLQESRPMTNWETKAAANSFLMEFEN